MRAGWRAFSSAPPFHLLTHFTHSLTNSHSLNLGHARSGGDAFAWARERLRPALERRKALEARCGEVAQADEARMIVQCMYVYVIVSMLLLRSIMPPVCMCGERQKNFVLSAEEAEAVPMRQVIV